MWWSSLRQVCQAQLLRPGTQTPATKAAVPGQARCSTGLSWANRFRSRLQPVSGCSTLNMLMFMLMRLSVLAP